MVNQRKIVMVVNIPIALTLSFIALKGWSLYGQWANLDVISWPIPIAIYPVSVLILAGALLLYGTKFGLKSIPLVIFVAGLFDLSDAVPTLMVRLWELQPYVYVQLVYTSAALLIARPYFKSSRWIAFAVAGYIVFGFVWWLYQIYEAMLFWTMFNVMYYKEKTPDEQL